MSDVTTRLALPLVAAGQAQKHVPVNEALHRLDAIVQLSVVSRSATSPPASPAAGARYIVAAGAAGAWAGKSGKVAAYDQGWMFFDPEDGWIAWIAAEQMFCVFTGGVWTPFADSSKLQGVQLFGLGTQASAGNPFSAKINNVLWTALGQSEGGTGSLRYVLNKESSSAVLSLLMQSGWGGRAEFGLVGDDDLVCKVSPMAGLGARPCASARTPGGFAFRKAASGSN